jgi:glycosyltransferase involved in cell wall biosynthesis
MRNVTVDVVTACLNSNGTIARCLDSVRSARGHINRFVVIDGKSTDGTLDVLERNRDIISTLVSEPDRGISDAFNKGILRCSGDFVLILNADDWLVEGALEDVIDCLSPQDDVVSPLLISYQGGKVNGIFRSAPERIPHHNSMLHPGALVRRSLYESLGGYDLQLRVAMDYDFFCRCYRDERSIRVIDLPLVYFSEGGISRQLKYRVFRESFHLRRKYFGARIPLYEAQQLLSRWIGDMLDVVGLKTVIKRALK